MNEVRPAIRKFLRRLIDEGHLRDELVEEAERLFTFNKGPWTLHDRRLAEAAAAEEWAAHASTLVPSQDEVLTKQAELLESGLDYGVGSIARALNTSETTVRRRLGRTK